MATDNEQAMTLAEKVAEVFGGAVTVGDFFRHYRDANFIPAVEDSREWAELKSREQWQREQLEARTKLFEPLRQWWSVLNNRISLPGRDYGEKLAEVQGHEALIDDLRALHAQTHAALARYQRREAAIVYLRQLRAVLLLQCEPTDAHLADVPDEKRAAILEHWRPVQEARQAEIAEREARRLSAETQRADQERERQEAEAAIREAVARMGETDVLLAGDALGAFSQLAQSNLATRRQYLATAAGRDQLARAFAAATNETARQILSRLAEIAECVRDEQKAKQAQAVLGTDEQAAQLAA